MRANVGEPPAEAVEPAAQPLADADDGPAGVEQDVGGFFEQCAVGIAEAGAGVVRGSRIVFMERI